MRDVRREVYEALANDSALTALLASGVDSVYMNVSEDAGTYPVIVVTIVDDVPALHGDDGEMASRIRFQITIITENAEYDGIESLARADIEALGAMRQISTEFTQDGRHYRCLQYIIGLYGGN